MAGAHHLHDDRLLDCYLAGRAGEHLDPPAAEHLADCHACGARYAELARLMDEVRSAADADMDAIFTPERLREQQAQIGARLQHLAHAARVITFPVRVGHRSSITPTRGVPRWIAAAAAAALFVGVGLGVFFEAGARSPRIARPHAAEAPFPTLALASDPAPERAALPDDDAFLSELELALDRPRTRELVAFDAFTPHVREITDYR